MLLIFNIKIYFYFFRVPLVPLVLLAQLVSLEYFKAVYYYPAYLTSVQSTSCKMPDWMKHKLESRLQGEISTTSDMQMIPL